MNRVPAWPEELAAIVEARRHTPFAWGSNDCAMFAADAVLAITGDDPAASLRGTYKTEIGAARKIKAAGGMRGLVNLPEKHPGLAQRGDVVLALCENRETFGIVVGGGYWCAPGKDGLVFRPLDEVLALFEV